MAYAVLRGRVRRTFAKLGLGVVRYSPWCAVCWAEATVRVLNSVEVVGVG